MKPILRSKADDRIAPASRAIASMAGMKDVLDEFGTDEGDSLNSWQQKLEIVGIRRLPLFQNPRILGDVHDLMFEDKQIGRTLSREADHIPVVIFNPTLHNLAVHQLYGDVFLLSPNAFR